MERLPVEYDSHWVVVCRSCGQHAGYMQFGVAVEEVEEKNLNQIADLETELVFGCGIEKMGQEKVL